MMFVLFLFTLLQFSHPAYPPATLTEAVNRVGLVEELKGREMAIDVGGYLEEVRKVFASGVAQEHAYRPALEKLFKSITPDVTAINEPKGIKVGRPDFVFLRSAGKGADITVGHCEAKDVGLGINPKGMSDFNKAQHERYVKALPNLVYTNGLDWRFYKKGELVREISIADFIMGIQPKPDQFAVLAHQLEDFCAERLQTITSAEKLAEMMAGKAVLIKDILFNSLKDDKDLRTDLTGQYESFKDMLIHDLSAEDFADLYAETIAYGMFGARLHDKTLDSFSRAEALDLMPKSNPFLRNLFTYVAGPQLDERIRRTIDELAEIFQATDLQKLFEDFGKFTQRNDPFIHFYETFLAEYNPAKRKARGVWYTPEPVVNFIVRAVDDVLKTEFGLPMGLADTSKVTVDWDTGQTDKKGKAITTRKEVHRVQILDPAAGTGTFLAEVIKQIAPRVKDVAEGQWSSYVEKELIPRLHGFELLMASYAMCHMKLDMMLTEMGYKPTSGTPPRLSVYLTNSLEEGERANQTLPFAQWLSNEAKEANAIKRDMPIMCVIGNPPYSGHSSNKGTWINRLVEDYKKSPELKKPAQAKWLSDDYVKFIRFAEHLIEKNGEGILAFITNHAYLDNPTFLDMRAHLMTTFDNIYVHDLHGNSMKRETAPDGSPDKNVFDIRPGVAILIGAKTRRNLPVRERVNRTVQFVDVWGDRQAKNNWLGSNSLASVTYQHISPKKKPWTFKPQDGVLFERYSSWPSLFELFSGHEKAAPGIVTTHDQFAISWDREEANEKVLRFINTADEAMARKQFSLCTQGQWNYARAKSTLQRLEWKNKIVPILYRPFDTRFTVYDSNVAVHRRERVSAHFVGHNNLGLIFSRQAISDAGGFNQIICTDKIFDNRGVYSNKGISSLAPLFIFPKADELDQTRRVNFDPKIHKAIIEAVVGKPSPAPRIKSGGHPLPQAGEVKVPDEVAIFDYIYGVLHCPAYRETYREFLKIDFPRVPYPPSPDVFWDVSAKGTALRRLHLMEDAAIGATPYKFTGQGDSVVGKVKYEGGRVSINDGQGFDGVPETAWNFYIGGYQPAQKWLKDRKGRELSFDDIKHYQKIIKILSETDRIMKTIEMPL